MWHDSDNKVILILSYRRIGNHGWPRKLATTTVAAFLLPGTVLGMYRQVMSLATRAQQAHAAGECILQQGGSDTVYS